MDIMDAKTSREVIYATSDEDIMGDDNEVKDLEEVLFSNSNGSSINRTYQATYIRRQDTLRAVIRCVCDADKKDTLP